MSTEVSMYECDFAMERVRMNPVKAKSGFGIYLELEDENTEWVFSYNGGEPLISRRTALRRANEIAKIGYLLPGGERVGSAYKVREVIPESTHLPELIAPRTAGLQ